jgi:hypothetical protein
MAYKTNEWVNSAVGINITLHWKPSKIKVPLYSGEPFPKIVQGYISEYRRDTYMVFKSSSESWCLVVARKSKKRPVAYFDYLVHAENAQDKALEYIADTVL